MAIEVSQKPLEYSWIIPAFCLVQQATRPTRGPETYSVAVTHSSPIWGRRRWFFQFNLRSIAGHEGAERHDPGRNHAVAGRLHGACAGRGQRPAADHRFHRRKSGDGGPVPRAKIPELADALDKVSQMALDFVNACKKANMPQGRLRLQIRAMYDSLRNLQYELQIAPSRPRGAARRTTPITSRPWAASPSPPAIVVAEDLNLLAWMQYPDQSARRRSPTWRALPSTFKSLSVKGFGDKPWAT